MDRLEGTADARRYAKRTARCLVAFTDQHTRISITYAPSASEAILFALAFPARAQLPTFTASNDDFFGIFFLIRTDPPLRAHVTSLNPGGVDF